MRTVIAGAVAILMAGSAIADTSFELKSEDEKLSYIFGYQLGQRLANDGVNVNIEVYTKALREGLDGEEFRMTPAEMQQVMSAFQANAAERVKALAEGNREAGKAYMAENRAKSGVVTLDSGLQYKVIEPGEGAKPKATDTVEVHYRGTLIDGREFDSSYSRNAPATFPVNRVIAGWTEILQMMPVGAKYEVTIPSGMAYGERGSQPMIGPNSVLNFEIELLDIK